MIPSKVMAKLATMGLSEEQAVAVATMLTEVEEATAAQAEAAAEIGRSKARARVQKWRDIHKSNVTERNVTLPGVTKRLVSERAPVEDKTSNLEIEPQKEEKKETREVALSTAFEDFWGLFPNKVGKPKAKSAFAAAERKAAPAAIIAGLQRYIATKPPDRPWLNPATFLNQERWADQPAVVQPSARGSPQPIKPPSQADVFKLIKENANGRQGYEDRSGVGAVVSYLPAVRSG